MSTNFEAPNHASAPDKFADAFVVVDVVAIYLSATRGRVAVRYLIGHAGALQVSTAN